MSMTFWDTVAGHDFARYTIPNLTKNIERLAKALEERNELDKAILKNAENKEGEK